MDLIRSMLRILGGPLLVLGVAGIVYLKADKEDQQSSKEEELVFPRKWKRLKWPFRFSKPVHKIRFRSYLQQRLTQYYVVLYCISLFVWLFATRAFDFIGTTAFLMYSGFYAWGFLICILLIEFALWLFIKCRIKRGDQRKIDW